jgi:hypothetical protein
LDSAKQLLGLGWISGEKSELVTLSGQVLTELTTDEACSAGDQDSHDVRPICSDHVFGGKCFRGWSTSQV